VGISRDCPFSGTPYYLRNGKSYSFQIWRVHSEGPSEQKSIKNFREKGAWAYTGTAQLFWYWYPLLSEELEKLQISNLASTFRGSIRIKAHEKFWRKRSVRVYRNCPNFLGIPYYLRNGKSYAFQIWPIYSEGPSEQNTINIFGEKGAWTYRGTAQFFQVPLIT